MLQTLDTYSVIVWLVLIRWGWVPSSESLSLAHHNKIMKTLETFNIGVFTPNIKVPVFAHLCKFQDDNIGQQIWDKWGAIGNMLGNTLWNYETCWEPIGNIGTTKIEHSPLFSKEKGFGRLGYFLACLIGCQEFSCFDFFYFFLIFFLPFFFTSLTIFLPILALANGMGRIVGTYCNQFGQDISVLG
jgi:hypothetical protein